MGLIAVIGYGLALIIAIIGPYIAIRKGFWTPKGIRLLFLVVAFPVAVGFAGQFIFEGESIIKRIFGASLSILIIMSIALLIGQIAIVIYSREPFRSRYRFQENNNKKGKNNLP